MTGPFPMNVLDKRAKTHGDFYYTARTAQDLKRALKDSPGWESLSQVRREALQMVCSKLARIVCGNPNELDHYVDIQGYIELAKPKKEQQTS
jgi:hypothetical protein